MRRVRFSLELSLRTDFADIFEVNAKRLARILIKSVPITRHLGEVLSGAIRDDRPIIGFVHNFASSCFGF
jgi:N-terminal domain of (some) glycogen debranching enzymes